MLDHDEIRVEKHIERYTRSDVARMLKSYLASGMAAMDETTSAMKDLFSQAR